MLDSILGGLIFYTKLPVIYVIIICILLKQIQHSSFIQQNQYYPDICDFIEALSQYLIFVFLADIFIGFNGAFNAISLKYYYLGPKLILIIIPFYLFNNLIQIFIPRVGQWASLRFVINVGGSIRLLFFDNQDFIIDNGVFLILTIFTGAIISFVLNMLIPIILNYQNLDELEPKWFNEFHYVPINLLPLFIFCYSGILTYTI